MEGGGGSGELVFTLFSLTSLGKLCKCQEVLLIRCAPYGDDLGRTWNAFIVKYHCILSIIIYSGNRKSSKIVWVFYLISFPAAVYLHAGSTHVAYIVVC